MLNNNLSIYDALYLIKNHLRSILQEKREQDTLETAAALAEFDMLDSLAFIIQKISCEVLLL